MVLVEQVAGWVLLKVYLALLEERGVALLLVVEQVGRVLSHDHRVPPSAQYNGDHREGSHPTCPSHAYRGLGTIWMPFLPQGHFGLDSD